MNLSTLDDIFWAAGLIWNVALLFVLIRKRRFVAFPWLVAYVTFELLFTIGLFFSYRNGSLRLYSRIYWIGTFLDILLQVAVVTEIARIVLAPAVLWVKSSRQWFMAVIGGGTLLAGMLAWGVHPSAKSSLDLWEMRGNLFGSILICEMFTAVLLTSQKLGLNWRNHVMSLGYGLTAWAIVSLAVDILHGYWGSVAHYAVLDHVRISSYLAALAFWTVSFWREEPERKPVTPEMQASLLHLSRKVSYDLAKVLGTRDKELR